MRDLLPFLKLYRRHFLAMSLGMLLAFVTLLSSLGLLALSGWFITSTALAGLTFATAQAFNFFTPGAGVRGFSIARTASRYFERLVSHDATFKLLSWLRGWFFARLTPLSISRLQRFRQGDLLNRLVADIDALDQLYLRLFSPLFAAVLVVLVLWGGLSFFSQKLGMAALQMMVFWLLLLPIVFYRLGDHSGQALGKLQGELRQKAIDYLQGMAESLIYGSEGQVRQSLNSIESELHGKQQKMARLEGLGNALLTFASGSSAVIMLYLAAGEYQAGVVSGPVMVLAVFAVLAGFEALMPVPGAFQFLGFTRQAARRLTEVLEETPVQFGSTQLDSVQGDIVFEGLSYRYNQTQTAVLDDLSLAIKSGEHVALLGKTGCGKSTLLRLLTRQLEADIGRITLDGHGIQTLSESTLYSAIAVVPQKTHVFSGTLRQNLQLADHSASDQELLDIVERVGLNSLAASEESGSLLDLWIGEGGIALSGGEQRRLAIARALLTSASVLIMDEPSEGLDPVSERQLMEYVLEAWKGKTLIMVTHKQVLLDRMDRIYRMDRGKVISHFIH